MNATAPSTSLPARTATLVFLSFAFAYFPSALVRGVVATLAPAFSAELQLTASELGLLAGAYFLGFAAMQLPLGSALDRHGPKRVLLVFLAVAVVGCGAFALADSFVALTVARALIGVGVSACLMAPMTSFRRNFTPTTQMRANSWMLMTGSLGLIASTLPVQWLMPLLGWRGLFWALAVFFVVAMVFIARAVPPDRLEVAPLPVVAGGYGEVFRHPVFLRYLPMGFFQYGGMVALQSLWIGPWLTRVCGWSPGETAAGLFGINVAMLLTFMAWGFLVPRLYARGWTAHGLIARGMPIPIVALWVGVGAGAEATAWLWGLFCVSSTFVSLSQPAIGQAFPASLAGRALSAYNLIIFAGVFTLQWAMGAAVDRLVGAGWSTVSAYQGAFALLAVCCSLSYLWFLWRREAGPAVAAAVTAR
ncbi:MFS transporter [Piscinibacter gummiphilus]|uniref:MFS transporter n=1 Tax=Piscinibacter gummiphilus TaxID=946333 RepID=A0ABZ0D0Y7_9BURK|nr:MFS transporter [Piscinibacter gummiphilus]WOB08955.1 MFS transporter [Piscinibacter gummiphilus]